MERTENFGSKRKRDNNGENRLKQDLCKSQGNQVALELESGLLDQIRDSLVLVDRDGSIQFGNEKFKRLVGNYLTSLTSILEFIDTEKHKIFMDMFNTCSKTRSKGSGVFSLSNATASCKISCFPNMTNDYVWLLVDSDECLMSHSMDVEIEAKKQLEECQQKLKEMTDAVDRLQRFADHAPAMIG
jgi:hypothetical protein